MNREIKFRVFMKAEEWDGVGEMFYDVIPTDKDFKTWLIAFEGEANGYDGDFKVGEHIEVMQYTGLKDKNGKEIYEGDIVNVPIGKKHVLHKGVIVWQEAGFIIDMSGSDWYDILRDLEVIGNVYETPQVPNKDQEVKVCDATMPNSSNST